MRITICVKRLLYDFINAAAKIIMFTKHLHAFVCVKFTYEAIVINIYFD